MVSVVYSWGTAVQSHKDNLNHLSRSCIQLLYYPQTASCWPAGCQLASGAARKAPNPFCSQSKMVLNESGTPTGFPLWSINDILINSSRIKAFKHQLVTAAMNPVKLALNVCKHLFAEQGVAATQLITPCPPKNIKSEVICIQGIFWIFLFVINEEH